MSDSIEGLEAKRKPGLLADGLNVILPGAGCICCGRVFLGS